MDTLLFLMQAKPREGAETGMTLAEIIGYGLFAFLVVFAIVSTRIVIECARHRYANPGIMAVLLYGSSLGPATVILLSMYGVLPGEEWMFTFALAGAGLWFLTLIGYTIYSAPKRKLAKAQDAGRAAQLQAELYGETPAQAEAAKIPGGLAVDDVIDADDPQQAPRRAISIPAADSDSERASEQTLKRMTLEKLEESDSGAPKPPRASEIPENPILPDEVVKIRCLACDKKMKAEGSKFARQRRCPACKAEPFRYVTAV